MSMKGFMARVERSVETAAATTAPVAPSAPAVRTVAPSTSVDASTVLEGTLRCKETLRIDGRVEGAVECDKSVLVGQGAQVHASITADEVHVAGVVEGDVAARRKITLERTAVVIGDLVTPGIVIEEGAKLKGQIVIGSDEETVEASAEASAPAKEASEAKDAKKAPAASRSQAAERRHDEARSPQRPSAVA